MCVCSIPSSRCRLRQLPSQVETAKKRDHIAATSPLGHVTVALWTLNRSHSHATMIFPSPCLAPIVWRPSSPPASMHTVSKDVVPLWVFYGYFVVIYGYFAAICCIHIPSTQSQILSCPSKRRNFIPDKPCRGDSVSRPHPNSPATRAISTKTGQVQPPVERGDRGGTGFGVWGCSGTEYPHCGNPAFALQTLRLAQRCGRRS